MKVLKRIVIATFDVLFVFLILWFVLGYLNFNKLSKGEKPIFVVSEEKYDVSDGKITVYDNVIYKIVKYEKSYVHTTYSLKLWFMDDVNRG